MKSKIKQIDFKKHIRKRPGMYLGDSGSSGIINLLKGLLSDCIIVTDSNKYSFKIELKTNFEFSLIIEASEDITKFEDTIKNETFKTYYLKVCKALSSEFSISYKKTNKAKLKFTLDKRILKEPVDYLELLDVIIQWSFLNRSSEVLLIDQRGKHTNKNYLCFPEGTKYLYDRVVKESLGRPEFEISFEGKLNGLQYQIFLGYRTDWYPPSIINSFANDNNTSSGGSLVEGVLEGLVNGCTKYAKQNNLIDLKIKKKKFQNGLILIASVRGNEFKYKGSFKESLEDDKVKKDAKKLIEKLTIKFITESKEKADKFLWRFDDKQLTSRMY